MLVELSASLSARVQVLLLKLKFTGGLSVSLPIGQVSGESYLPNTKSSCCRWPDGTFFKPCHLSKMVSRIFCPVVAVVHGSYCIVKKKNIIKRNVHNFFVILLSFLPVFELCSF